MPRASAEPLVELEAAVTADHLAAIRSYLADQGLDPAVIDLVGLHGQTICHCPEQCFTRQLIDDQAVADALGVPAVSPISTARPSLPSIPARPAPSSTISCCAASAAPMTRTVRWPRPGASARISSPASWRTRSSTGRRRNRWIATISIAVPRSSRRSPMPMAPRCWRPSPSRAWWRRRAMYRAGRSAGSSAAAAGSTGTSWRGLPSGWGPGRSRRGRGLERQCARSADLRLFSRSVRSSSCPSAFPPRPVCHGR